MKSIIIIGILFTIMLVGCATLPQDDVLSQDDDLVQEEGKVWVEKHITQCGEEWHEVTREDQGIKDFYAGKGITIFNIEWKDARGQDCEACSCLSDKIILLQISNEDKDYFLGLGYE